MFDAQDHIAGAAFFPRDGHDVDELMRHARLALNAARTDTANYRFFTKSLDRAARTRGRQGYCSASPRCLRRAACQLGTIRGTRFWYSRYSSPKWAANSRSSMIESTHNERVNIAQFISRVVKPAVPPHVSGRP